MAQNWNSNLELQFEFLSTLPIIIIIIVPINLIFNNFILIVLIF